MTVETLRRGENFSFKAIATATLPLTACDRVVDIVATEMEDAWIQVHKVIEKLTSEEIHGVETFSVVRKERDDLKKDHAELLKGVICVSY